MAESEHSKQLRVKDWAWWRGTFFAGLFIVVPVVATFWILSLLYNLVSRVSDPIVTGFVSIFRTSLPDLIIIKNSEGQETVPFAAFIITFLIVMGVGLLAKVVVVKRVSLSVDHFVSKIPLVNIIYPLAKQVMDSLKNLGNSANKFENKQVVFLKYPAMKGYLVGFMTGVFETMDGERMASVFIPTAPNPVTGFVLVFHEKDVIKSELPMEEAWKMLISAGLIPPKNLRNPLASLDPAKSGVVVPEPIGTKQTE